MAGMEGPGTVPTRDECTGGRVGAPPLPPDDEMTITKCRPTKVQCSHNPASLLSETQDEALDVGHGCNPNKTKMCSISASSSVT